MTEKFEVVINSNSYIWKNGKIDRFGDIHIKLDDYNFPSEVWNDFGSDIVYWWMESFLKLLGGQEEKVACSFMDGNYRFDISALNSQLWKFQCVRENTQSEDIWYEANVNVKQSIEAITKTAKEFQSLAKMSGEEVSVANYENRIERLSSFLKA